MEITEKRLRELIINAIKLFQSESSKSTLSIPKKRLYVILTEGLNHKYISFFDNLNKQEEYEAYVIVSPYEDKKALEDKFREFHSIKAVVNINEINLQELSRYITIFPMISRNTVVKTALCLDDDLYTKWIFKSMEKGERIVILKSGLDRFTGKEPVAYRQKILGYYRTLLEYDIEIIDDFFQIKDEDENFNFNTVGSNTVEKIGKRVITEREIEGYRFSRKIVLNPGDIITDMARDKAHSLNIEIVKV